ncbi:MAG: ABC transporter ATP-binding protein [Clostridia bacterium]
MKMLECMDVVKKYDSFTLGPINLSITSGEIVGLVGENGAGKTTLIRLLLGQMECTEGVVKIFESSNQKQEIENKNRIGFVTDECCFHHCLCAHNINAIMRKIYTAWDANAFFAQLNAFHLPPKKKVQEYSSGMKNKLMLAVALAHQPRLLILDEITSGLDPIVRDEILTVLSDYAKQNKAGILFSTHITSDLDKIADRIAFLHDGQLLFVERLEALRSQYGLLECTNDELAAIPSDAVCRMISKGTTCSLLIDRNKLPTKANITVPTIDDMMLMYIKGVK